MIRQTVLALRAIWRELEDDHNAKMRLAPITSGDAELWEDFS